MKYRKENRENPYTLTLTIVIMLIISDISSVRTYTNLTLFLHSLHCSYINALSDGLMTDCNWVTS